MRIRGSVLLAASLLIALTCAAEAAALTPNDPNWDRAWGQRLVNMPAAWDVTTGDPNVIVAVVDTGVDPSTPDLQGALVPGWDYLTNDFTRQDTGGHGTLSATIIAGRGNDGYGVAGYCWRCKIMPVRVSSSGAGFDSTLVANGINWAVDHGARIISIGFSDEGENSGSPEVAAAISNAAKRNVLVLASAGNSGSSGFTHPASDPGAYAVAATTDADALFTWATYGSWVPLAAPGCQLGIWAGRGVMDACGSSVSAPAVAGIAALMLSVNPSLNPGQIVSALQQTAVPVAGIAGGRVNAYRALLAIGATPLAPPAPPPPPPLPSPPPPVSTTPRKPLPVGPQLKTRVQRTMLRRHWQIKFRVADGRLQATLRSAKAKSCTLSLRSDGEVWVTDAYARAAVSLSARVSAGKYAVDVSCSARQPRRSALVLRAVFA